jgi:hypothetical protein
VGVSDEKPKLFEWTETWIQESDTNDPGGGQALRLKAEDNGAGEGCFLVVETKRWALDRENIDAFADALKRFIERGDPPPKSEKAAT